MESYLVTLAAGGDLQCVQRHLRVMTANCLDSADKLKAIQKLRTERDKALMAALNAGHKHITAFLKMHGAVLQD